MSKRENTYSNFFTRRHGHPYRNRLCLRQAEKESRNSNLIEKHLKNNQAILKEIKGINDHFKENFLAGRKWVAKLIAEYKSSRDEAVENYLRYKKRPAFYRWSGFKK